MKLLHLVLVLIVLLVAGCGQGSSATPAVSDIQMSFSVEPDPPAVGDSTLIIRLTHTDGTPIDGATLNAQGNMDHAGMEGVEGKAESGSGGEYRIPFQWTMGGGWQVEVMATLPDGGGTAVETFAVDVSAVAQQSIINQHDAGRMDMANMGTPTPDAGE